MGEVSAAEPPFHRIAIVGLGLIGGSLALAIRRHWPSVHLVGVDAPEVVMEATGRGVVDDGSSELYPTADADLIVLAAPVRQNLSLLAQLERYVAGGVVVTDTGSTKRDIVHAAAELPPRFTFIGGHPLGGAAVGGLRHARADLFEDRPWILTPAPDADAREVGRLTALVQALGSRLSVMDAAQHDRVLAFISHLPQLTASALMQVVGSAVGRDGLTLAGAGLVDTTRLASSPPDIWRDIAASNADEIAPALDALIDALVLLRDDLQQGRRLTDLFSAAAEWREQLVSRAQL
jgi:prephenate dehydrogenase